MTVFEKVSRLNAEEFKRSIGVSLDIFHRICAAVSNVIDKGKEENPMRKRGVKTGISVENQVLIFFYYIRDYPTFLKLGQQFNISESYTHRIYHRVLNIIVQTFKLPNRKILLQGKKKDIQLRFS